MSNDIKNDRAVLKRVQLEGRKHHGYRWRGWVVHRASTYTDERYAVTNEEHGMRFRADALNDVRAVLPQTDQVAKTGTMPDNCRSTAKRDRRKARDQKAALLQLPLEERRTLADAQVVAYLQELVDEGEQMKQKFVDKVANDPIRALEQGVAITIPYLIGCRCAEILEYEKEHPEELPMVVQRYHDAYAKQLVENRYAGGGGPFRCAVDHAKRAAYSSLVHDLEWRCLSYYREYNVPTTQGEEDTAK